MAHSTTSSNNFDFSVPIKCILVGGPTKTAYMNSLSPSGLSDTTNGVHVDLLDWETNRGMVQFKVWWTPDGQDLPDEYYSGAQSAIILVDATSRGQVALWEEKICHLCGDIPCIVADNEDNDNAAAA